MRYLSRIYFEGDSTSGDEIDELFSHLEQFEPPADFVDRVMAEVSRPGVSMAKQAGKSLYQIAWKPQLSSLHGKALQEYFDAADPGADHRHAGTLA